MNKRISSRRHTSQKKDVLRYSKHASGAFPTFAQWRYFSHLIKPFERALLVLCTLLLLLGGLALSIRWYYAHSAVLPSVGGTYSEALIGTPQHINPILSPLSDANSDADISALLYSSIFTYDENRNLEPDLITNYTQDNDRTYTFYLRHGMKWHDGEEITADDIEFTINAIQNEAYNSPLQSTIKKATFTKLDPYSFRLELPEPYGPFLSSLTFGILPEHVWYRVPPQNIRTTELNLAPIGSGPYIFDSLVKDRDGNMKSMVLLRNDEYYKEKAYIEEIRFVFYPDVFTAANALLNAEVDGMSFLPQDLRDEAEKNNDLALHYLRIPQYSAVYFHQENSVVLEDDDVRTALAYATDKSGIIQSALKGDGEMIHAPILPGYLGYHGEIQKYDYNTQEAIAILERDKWVVPKKQPAIEEKTTSAKEVIPAPQIAVRTKNNTPLAFRLATVDIPEYRKTAEALQQQWAAIGVAVTIDIFSIDTMQNEVLAKRNYDAILFSTIASNDPDPYPFWHSSNQKAPGLALSVFSDLESDKLLEDARTTTDEAVRKEKYIAFQDLLAKEVPAIFLYQPRRLYVMNTKIRGVQENQYISIPAHRFAAMNKWYIEFKRQRNE